MIVQRLKFYNKCEIFVIFNETNFDDFDVIYFTLQIK